MDLKGLSINLLITIPQSRKQSVRTTGLSGSKQYDL